MKLLNTPRKFSIRELAFSWVERSNIPLAIILGDDGYFWVVGVRDFKTLIEAGYSEAL